MRAVVYGSYGEHPSVRDVGVPRCPADSAVIAVGATGVCRSDWHAWQGREEVALPHVPGHEFAGTIAEVGPKVAHWAPGARVTAPFVCGCGSCASCLAGDHQVCEQQTQPGFTHWGSFAEYVVVRHADVNLVGLPDALPFATAAALGCRFATAYRAVRVHAGVGAGDWIAVYGCGGVGLSAVMIAVAAGTRVVAVDPSAAARAAAADLGAERVLDPAGLTGPLVGHAVRALTGGGTHAGLDALGSRLTSEASVHGLRRRGRHVQVGLLLGDEASPALPLAAMIGNEQSFHGSHGMSAADYPAMLAEIASGRLQPDRLVVSVITLDEAPAALAAMSAPSSGSGMTVIAL